MDYRTAVKVAGGFGGGMYLGSLCGAITGGIMAIGLKCGGVGMQPSVQTANIVRTFTNRFKAKHQSINCTDLLGGVDLSKVDMSNPERLSEFYKDAMQKKVFASCAAYVRDATTIIDELLNEAAKSES